MTTSQPISYQIREMYLLHDAQLLDELLNTIRRNKASLIDVSWRDDLGENTKVASVCIPHCQKAEENCDIKTANTPTCFGNRIHFKYFEIGLTN